MVVHYLQLLYLLLKKDKRNEPIQCRNNDTRAKFLCSPGLYRYENLLSRTKQTKKLRLTKNFSFKTSHIQKNIPKDNNYVIDHSYLKHFSFLVFSMLSQLHTHTQNYIFSVIRKKISEKKFK